MIPTIIHQSAPRDKSKWHMLWEHYQKSWMNQFPDFEYKLWDDDELDNLIKTKYRWFYDIYQKYNENIKRVDAARYFILYEHGGIYADMDFECVNNFWNNIPQDNVSIAETGNLGVCRMENALMISPKQHNFWMLVFSQLIENKDKHVFTATGPILIEKCIEQYNQENIGSSINILNNRQYSLHNKDKDKFAIHHQTGVWLPKADKKNNLKDRIVYHDNLQDIVTVSIVPHVYIDAFEINVFNSHIEVKRLDYVGGWGQNLNLIITKLYDKTKTVCNIGSSDSHSKKVSVTIGDISSNKPKLRLKDTTLVCIDCIDGNRAIKAIEKTMEQCSFDEILLLTSLDTNYKHAIKINQIKSIEEYSVFCIKELHKFVKTKNLLIIQHDGYVIDTDRWKDEFYEYDYIGLVCGWTDNELKGGNGGVSWRSRKLMEKASEIIPLEHCHPEDVALSGAIKGIYPNGYKWSGYRSELEQLGFKFADVEIQKFFGFEECEYKNTFAHHKGQIEAIYAQIKNKKNKMSHQNLNLLETYLRNSHMYSTDKNTVHSYIEHIYNDIFKKTFLDILEIGAFSGGSVLLWRDYFTNANIDVIDTHPCANIENQDRINFILGDAYCSETIQKLKKYDLIIDDGPHTLDSMIFFVQNYINLLKIEGIAIIEDVQEYSWFNILMSLIPKNYIGKIIDLRHIKNRYDDLLLIIKHKN